MYPTPAGVVFSRPHPARKSLKHNFEETWSVFLLDSFTFPHHGNTGLHIYIT